MKLFSTFVFLNQANGSHFRGGSYQVIPDNDAGTVQVAFTHAWRRFFSGKLKLRLCDVICDNCFKALKMVAIKVIYKHGLIGH